MVQNYKHASNTKWTLQDVGAEHSSCRTHYPRYNMSGLKTSMDTEYSHRYLYHIVAEKNDSLQL